MKKLLLLITVLLPVIVFSQNYKVVSDVLPAYYHSEVGEGFMPALKTFAYDSISLSGSDTVFYTFETIRDTTNWGWAVCVDSSAGSIMGKKILQQTNRSLLFNIYGDTIFIIQNSEAGAKWKYFKYNNGEYIEAKHIQTEFRDVIGISDSLKTFVLTHRDVNGVKIDDELNGTEIQLSKHFGFVQTVDNYLFPEYQFSCSLLGYENPETGVQNLTVQRAYDYQIGDVFHFYREDLHWYFNEEDTLYEIDYGRKSWVIRNVMYRTNYQDSVMYEFLECSRNFDYSDNEYDTVYITETVLETIIYDSILPGVIDSYTNQKVKMENWGGEFYYGIYQGILLSTFNFLPGKAITEGSYEYFDTCLVRSFSDPGGYGESYLTGCGGPYFKWSNWSNLTIENKLLYFNKNGDIWGEPIANDCEDLLSDITESISPRKPCLIYPNPFSDIINVESPYNKSFRLIRLYDINGVLINSYETDAGKFQLDSRDLPKGIYVIELILKDNTILREKIFKQ